MAGSAEVDNRGNQTNVDSVKTWQIDIKMTYIGAKLSGECGDFLLRGFELPSQFANLKEVNQLNIENWIAQ